MRRRALLASVAAATSLTGCSGRDRPTTDETSSAADDAVPTTDGDRSGTTVPPDVIRRRVSLGSVDGVPDRFGVGIDASVVDPTVDWESTAVVSVRVTVDEDPRVLDVTEGKCAFFNRTSGRSADDALWLVPPGLPGIVCPKGRLREGAPWRMGADCEELGYLMYGCVDRQFDAGESVVNEFHLYDGPAGGYLPTGVHRFEREVEVRIERGGTPTGAFSWGFDLRVSEPGET